MSLYEEVQQMDVSITMTFGEWDKVRAAIAFNKELEGELNHIGNVMLKRYREAIETQARGLRKD